MFRSTSFILALAAAVSAHTAAWAPGMYCRGGNDTTQDDQNTNLAVNPLYMLSKEDWWFQHDRGCDRVPPPDGEFLELPARGTFTVEHAHNRAFTTLSYGGKLVTDWPDGGQHPEDWTGWTGEGEGCIQDDGALHVQNETSATGTAFAISYHSDISEVTLENLAVFTVLEHTPWKRVATYEVPDLPACPPGGCTCAWLWVPKGCGQPNVYMQGFKCMVTGATATHAIASAQSPVYCKDDSSECVKGAKEMIVWNQAEGNNVQPPQFVSPGYNAAWGYLPGAQDDIFSPVEPVPSSSSAFASPASSSVEPLSPSSSWITTLSAPVKAISVATSSWSTSSAEATVPMSSTTPTATVSWDSVSTFMTQIRPATTLPPLSSSHHACHHGHE